MTSVSRALVTIKHFKQSFSEKLNALQFSGVFRNKSEISTGLPILETIKSVDKNIQSQKDKILADFKLRTEVNKINQTATVVVNGKVMTIADALIYRTHTIPLLETLKNKLKSDLNNARRLYQRAEVEYQSKINSEPDEEIRKLIEAREKPEILSITDEIVYLEAELDFFKLEFDAVLTETNPGLKLDL